MIKCRVWMMGTTIATGEAATEIEAIIDALGRALRSGVHDPRYSDINEVLSEMTLEIVE